MISYNIIYSILVLLLTAVLCNTVEYCTEEAGDVTFITQFGVEVQITSPQYPINYTTYAECYFAQVGGFLVEDFVFSVVQEVTECSIPYTVVGSDNSHIPNQYETCSKEGNIFISKNFILKRGLEIFRFILPAGSISSFTFTVAAYPLLSMESTNTTVNLTTTSTAYITSHQEFPESPYSNILHNMLTLSDIPSGYDVVIEFVFMKLGTWDRCSRTENGLKDVFKVYRDEEIDPVYECADYIGTSTPDPHQISSANSIRLEFITNNQDVYKGFLLQVHRLPSNSGTSTVTSLYGTSIDETVGAGVSTSIINTTSPTSTTSTTSTASTASTISTTSTVSSARSSGFEANSSATDSTTNSSDTSSSLTISTSATSYYSTSVLDTQPNATTDGLTMTDNTVPENKVIISAIVAGSGGFLLLVIIAVLAFKLARHPSNRKHPDEPLEGEEEVGDIHVKSKGTTPSAAGDTNMMDSRPNVAMMSGYSDVELSYTTADIRYPVAVKCAGREESSKGETAVDEGPVYTAINKGQTITKEVVSNASVYAAIDETNKKRGNDEEKGAVMVDEVEMIANDLYDTY